MIKVFGERGSGKTTKLIELAHENGYILVVPNFRMSKYAAELAAHLGYRDVQIIDFTHFLARFPKCKEKFLIDELDMCLADLYVAGYSINEEAESNE